MLAYWRLRAAMGQFLGTQIVVGFDPSLFLPSETIGEHLRCQDAKKKLEMSQRQKSTWEWPKSENC